MSRNSFQEVYYSYSVCYNILLLWDGITVSFFTKMKRSSLIKIIFFSTAIIANVRYFLFLINPVHIGVPWFFGLIFIADLISLIVLTSTWLSCLHFELMRERYNKEIKDAQEKGIYLLKKKAAILIPTVNEEIEIISQTLKAALKIKGRKEVFLLDDGKRDELKELANKLGVRYLRREGRDYFKSGNLNHGLKHIDSDFIAVFDADFIAHEDYLKKTLPLFVDQEVGAVQTPQVYYNKGNLFSTGSQNYQRIFYEYIMPSKHLLNSAFIVGTNVIYRKEALDTIGGIPLVHHSEDVFTALK